MNKKLNNFIKNLNNRGDDLLLINEDNWLNNYVADKVEKELGSLSSKDFLSIECISTPSKNIKDIPRSIKFLTKLIELDLSHNQLTSLPPEIGSLTNLKTLFLYQNQLTTLPPEIGNLTKLTTLYLHYNQLTTIPPEIGNLPNLAYLGLYNNQLTTIPPEIECLWDKRNT